MLRNIALFSFLFFSSSFAFAEWIYGGNDSSYESLKSGCSDYYYSIGYKSKVTFVSQSNYQCFYFYPKEGNPCPSSEAWDQSLGSCVPEPSDCPDGSSFNEWGRCNGDQCPAGAWSNPEITAPYPNGSCPQDSCSDGSTANEFYGCPDENTSSASSDSNGNSSAVNTSSTGQQNSTGTASSAGDSGGSSGTGSSSGGGGGDGGGGDSGGGSGSEGSGSSSGGGSGSEGSGSSSGDGSGSYGSASSGSGTASGGETCDSAPTCSGDEIQCAQLNQQWLARCSAGLTADDVAGAIAEADQNGQQLLDDVFSEQDSLLTEGFDDVSSISTEHVGFFSSLIQDFLPEPVACTNTSINFPEPVGDLVIDCALFDMFKAAYLWFLTVMTLIYVWHTITQPVNR